MFEYLTNIQIFNNLLWLFLISVIFLALKKCYSHLRIMIVLNKFPAPERSFISGDTNNLSQPPEQLHATLRKWGKELYPHYTLRVFHCVTLQVFSPEDCKLILGSKSSASKRGVYAVLRSWLQEGLLTSIGEKWTKRRRILTPAFHFKILRSFVPIFNEQIDRILDKISKTGSESIDVHRLSQDFSLRTILETSMGAKLDPSNQKNREYIDAIRKIDDVFLQKTMVPIPDNSILWMFTTLGQVEKKLINILQKFTENVIRERLKSFEGLTIENCKNDEQDDCIYLNSKERRLAMLDLLLQAQFEGEDIDFEGIREEVDVFMFGGHDTSATTVAFCLMLIANHPEIQDQIFEETKSILTDKKQRPTFDDIREMELLERCIKETLRLFPVVHFISRRIERDIVLASGLVCPKDAIINIQIFDMHRNPNIYPNPDKFDPDRFLPENIKERHPFAFIPFSAGPRNCIGQKFAMIEMKAYISRIIRNFKLIPVDTPENIDLELGIVLRARNGINVKFIPRT